VSESLAAWLTLREAADARSRSASLVESLVELLPPDRPLRVLDLGTGTGANIRYLTPKLPVPHEWLAVDRDQSVLSLVPGHITTRCMELGTLDDPSLFWGRHLVTASALLDLVSARWLASLAKWCREAGAAALFALNYDGRFICSPAEAEDELVRELFNAHQRRNDKGFGTAAGPDAAAAAVRAFEAAGYTVRCEMSDWELAPDEDAMQRMLIAGWAQAASEADESQGRVIRNWLARRLAHVDEGRSRIRVGHEDIAAWPVR
jgi:hypothetical protein